uniref:Uncharacterized protein n=1 Tax=Rhizophora mucronata TaxID=61149 RepID=A0A2P2QU68_RHIMU
MGLQRFHDEGGKENFSSHLIGNQIPKLV